MRVCTSAILACLFPRCFESRGIVKNAQATAEKAVTTGTDYARLKELTPAVKDYRITFVFVFIYLPHDYNNYKEMPKKM